MKELFNKNPKMTLCVLSVIYFILGIVTMVINEYFNTYWLFYIFALAALIVFVFVLAGKKWMSLVPAGAFLICAVISLILFINSIINLSESNGGYVVVAILNFIIVLVEFACCVLNCISSLKAFKNKYGPFDAKFFVLVLLGCAVLSFILFLIYYIVMAAKYDINITKPIIDLILSLIGSSALWLAFYSFVSSAELEEIKFD